MTNENIAVTFGRPLDGALSQGSFIYNETQ